MVDACAILQAERGYHASHRDVKTLAGLSVTRHLQEGIAMWVRARPTSQPPWPGPCQEELLWSLQGPVLVRSKVNISFARGWEAPQGCSGLAYSLY